MIQELKRMGIDIMLGLYVAILALASLVNLVSKIRRKL